MFRCTLIIFRNLLNINKTYMKTLCLFYWLLNSLKMIRIDRNMSDLWWILCKYIILALVHLLLLLYELYIIKFYIRSHCGSIHMKGSFNVFTYTYIINILVYFMYLVRRKLFRIFQIIPHLFANTDCTWHTQTLSPPREQQSYIKSKWPLLKWR